MILARWHESKPALCSLDSLLLAEDVDVLSSLLFRGSLQERELNTLGSIDFQTDAKLGTIDFPDLHIIRPASAIIRGADVIYVNGEPSFYKQCHPLYAASMFPYSNREVQGCGIKEVIDISYPLASFCHWTQRTYGHFLLEMLPKVIGFIRLKSIVRNAKLVMSSHAGERAIKIVRHLIGSDSIFVYNGNTQEVHASQLLVLPSFIDDGAIHPLMDAFVLYAQSLACREVKPKQVVNKVYVSKDRFRKSSSRSDYRSLVNEDQVRLLMEKRGFTVIYPEELSWFEQVAVFSSASVVVGEFTSALHNTIFSPSYASVVSINKVNRMQDCIASYAGHRIGYILPSDGIPRVANSLNQSPEYEIDIDELSMMLDLISND